MVSNFIPFRLAWWLAFGEVDVSREMLFKINNIGAQGFTIFWLIGWTVGGIFAFIAWIWNVAGKEVISFSHGILRIEKKVWNCGPVKEYYLEQASKFRISMPANNNGMNYWGMGGGMVSFDYGMKTIRFANGLEEAEANYILDEMKKYNIIKA